MCVCVCVVSSLLPFVQRMNYIASVVRFSFSLFSQPKKVSIQLLTGDLRSTSFVHNIIIVYGLGPTTHSYFFWLTDAAIRDTTFATLTHQFDPNAMANSIRWQAFINFDHHWRVWTILAHEMHRSGWFWEMRVTRTTEREAGNAVLLIMQSQVVVDSDSSGIPSRIKCHRRCPENIVNCIVRLACQEFLLLHFRRALGSTHRRGVSCVLYTQTNKRVSHGNSYALDLERWTLSNFVIH